VRGGLTHAGTNAGYGAYARQAIPRSMSGSSQPTPTELLVRHLSIGHETCNALNQLEQMEVYSSAAHGRDASLRPEDRHMSRFSC